MRPGFSWRFVAMVLLSSSQTWFVVGNSKSAPSSSHVTTINCDRFRFKYPLACIEKMLNVFGKNIGGGFDTGCQLDITIKNSALGPRAQELNYTSLVDGFHGHAHRRLCQLSYLATYRKGLGLEDLGMCERVFSRSNGNTSTVRHMSVFHCQQALVEYFGNIDHLETYQNLSMCNSSFFSSSTDYFY